jgi:O-acetylserine/cysteine efflux transporter
MSVQHLFLAVFIAAIWGGNLVAIKMGLQQFPPFLLSSLRFFLILAALFPFLKIVRGQMKYILGICVFAGALHFAATFVGLNLAHDTSSAAIAVQLNVPFATLLAVIFLGERVHFWRIFGMVLAFSGVLVLGFDPHVLKYVDALFVIAFAALVYAIGTVMMRKVKGVTVFQLQAWIALVSFPFLAILSLVTEPGQWHRIPEIAPMTVGSVLFSAIGASLIGHGGIYYLLQRYPVAVVAPFLLLGPVFGVVFAVIFLHDTLTLQMVVGGLITLAGVTIITLREKKPPIPALEGLTVEETL